MHFHAIYLNLTSYQQCFYTLLCVCVYLVAQLCLTVCEPMDCSPPGPSVHRDCPGKNTGVDNHSLLQGIFPTQGLNPDFSHCRQILYHLSHQEAHTPQAPS